MIGLLWVASEPLTQEDVYVAYTFDSVGAPSFVYDLQGTTTYLNGYYFVFYRYQKRISCVAVGYR